MNRPSRKRRRAWCLETLPLGNMRSLPWTRPTLISFLSKVSLRSAPPFSLMMIANIQVPWGPQTGDSREGSVHVGRTLSDHVPNRERNQVGHYPPLLAQDGVSPSPRL